MAVAPMKDAIRALADRYAAELKRNIDLRVADMDQDDRSHVLIYEVLGISKDEGKLIDVYQNKGRFLCISKPSASRKHWKASTRVCKANITTPMRLGFT